MIFFNSTSRLSTGVSRFSFLVSWMMIIMIAIVPFSCVDQDFDAPPATDIDPNLPVNTTIAEIKAMHDLGQNEQITEDLTFSAIVISNDEAGNFFKQLVVADETGGIEIRVDMTDMFTIYPVGRKVYVRVKNLWLGDYNGLTQLGIAVDQSSGDLLRIPEPLVSGIIVPASFNNPVVPKVVTIDELSIADVSTLIKIVGVQFTSGDAGETYADAVQDLSLNRIIQDCAQRSVILRSSGFARFAADLTPEGNGSVTAVLGIFGEDFQLTIRDVNDVDMTGSRCMTNEFTIAALRSLYTGSATTVPAGSIRGVVTSDFTSQSVTGRNLYIQDATGGIVVRFDANHSLNLGDEATIDVTGGSLNEFNGLLQIDGLGAGAATFE
nr:DUF5689 domain-containing protein [Bacteroidota bacterium]